MNEDVLLFISIVAGLLIFGGGLFGFLFWTTTTALKPVQTAADRFLTALKEEAIEQAYDTLLTRRFRDLTSPGVISKQLQAHGRWIAQWRWTRVETTGDSGFLKGEVTFTDGQTTPIRLMMSHINDVWLVDGLEWLE